MLSDEHYLQEWARQHPQCVKGTERNPDDGGEGNEPANPLSPGGEHIVFIAGWFELDDGENEEDLPAEMFYVNLWQF